MQSKEVSSNDSKLYREPNKSSWKFQLRSPTERIKTIKTESKNLISFESTRALTSQKIFSEKVKTFPTKL